MVQIVHCDVKPDNLLLRPADLVGIQRGHDWLPWNVVGLGYGCYMMVSQDIGDLKKWLGFFSINGQYWMIGGVTYFEKHQHPVTSVSWIIVHTLVSHQPCN